MALRDDDAPMQKQLPAPNSGATANDGELR